MEAADLECEIDLETEAADMIGRTVEFLVNCKDKGEILGRKASPSIFMVPSAFRDLSPSSFNPRVVSIGPLHRQDEHLLGFEVNKTTSLHNLLHGLGFDDSEQTLRECVEKVIGSIERIKACYGGSTNYNDFELAKMMVIDGCFILEFFWSHSQVSIKSNILINPLIMSDLLLVENQIPFFVLENIFACTFKASLRAVEGSSFTMLLELAFRYYRVFNGNSVVPNLNLDSTPDHILGLLQKYYQPVEPMTPSSAFESDPKGHSAIELDRAGMNFKRKEDQNCAISMNLELPRFPCFPWFSCKPTLRMPIVALSDHTELILRNLIIYEQSSDVKKYVTSYVWAMDMLIDTPQDVALLVKSKILTNYFGSNEDAANMINNVSKNITAPVFFYHKQWEEMDAYYNSYWPHTVAMLKHKYFNNPWSVLALFAAFLLFSLTVVQTIFTIKGPV